MQQSWDAFFLKICNTISTNSKCLSRQIGAILVRDKTVISMGYNGPPRGIPPCDNRYIDDNNVWKPLIQKLGITEEEYVQWRVVHADRVERKCPRQILEYKSGDGLHLCVASHGEENAIVNAAREGIITKGSTMYMNCGIPCKDCFKKIINAGIAEIVCTNLTTYDIMTDYLLEQSHVKARVYDCDITNQSEYDNGGTKEPDEKESSKEEEKG